MNTRSATILATIITSLLAFTSASDALAQGGTWTTIAPMPIAVVETSGVAVGGKFYVIDGSNGSVEPT